MLGGFAVTGSRSDAGPVSASASSGNAGSSRRCGDGTDRFVGFRGVRCWPVFARSASRAVLGFSLRFGASDTGGAEMTRSSSCARSSRDETGTSGGRETDRAVVGVVVLSGETRDGMCDGAGSFFAGAMTTSAGLLASSIRTGGCSSGALRRVLGGGAEAERTGDLSRGRSGTLSRGTSSRARRSGRRGSSTRRKRGESFVDRDTRGARTSWTRFALPLPSPSAPFAPPCVTPFPCHKRARATMRRPPSAGGLESDDKHRRPRRSEELLRAASERKLGVGRPPARPDDDEPSMP